ncbi:MAG: hypothetical protein AB8C95_04980 [Phycisphaeraceae bacterium]
MDQQEQPAIEVDLEDFAVATSRAADPHRRKQRQRSKERRRQVSGGRIALLASAMIPGFGIFLFAGIWLLSGSDLALFMVLANLLVASIYAALYVWARKQPVKGLQAGYRLVFLLLAIEIGLVISSPTVPFVSGLIMRIITLQLLVKGLKAAKKRQAIQEQAALLS